MTAPRRRSPDDDDDNDGDDDDDKATAPADRRHRLATIAGRWATEGHVTGDPSTPVSGFDTYDVLPGGWFLVHHVDVTVGDQHVRAIEILGEPDGRGDGFLARSFDDRGKTEVMSLDIDDAGVFHFAGGADVAAAARPAGASNVAVRSTLTPPTADGSSMTALWERSSDGDRWEPWMHLTFTRRPA